MGFVYFLVAVVQALMWVLLVALAVGVPLFILWQIVRRWKSPRARWLWIAGGVVWMLPNAVEYGRGQVLRNWVADLPPSPVVALPEGSVLALRGGIFEAELGLASFASCLTQRYDVPLCSFMLGPEEIARGQAIGLQQGEGWAALDWAHGEGCRLDLRYNQIADVISDFFVSQRMCPRLTPLDAEVRPMVLAHRSGTLPLHRGVPFGQIVMTQQGADEPLTTLTSFAVDRPLYPVLWGVHWLPVFKGFTPKRIYEYRYGEEFDQDKMTGFPKATLHDIAFSRGWGRNDCCGSDPFAHLAQIYGYAPNHALPALRSESFFPVTFALRVVCSDALRDQVTPQIIAEIEKIKVSTVRYNNNLPRTLATDALDSGCGAGL